MELLSELQQNKLRTLPATHFKTRCKRNNGFAGCLFHFPDNQPVTVVFRESALKGYACDESKTPIK